MIRIKDIYQEGHLGISIEIYPPKDPSGDKPLYRAVKRLARFKPEFISCTYGARGSTRDRTLEICVQIQKQFSLCTTTHFTCIGSTREKMIK